MGAMVKTVLATLVLVCMASSQAWAQAPVPDAGIGADVGVVDNDPIKPPIVGELSIEQAFTIDAPAAQGQDPVATVGTRLVLELNVVHPQNATVALPEGQKTGRFELLGVERDPVVPRGATSVSETLRLILASYRPGRHTLAPFQLQVLDAEGRMSTLETKPVEVVVQSVMANDNEVVMPEPKPPVSVWHEDWTLAWIFGSLLGLLLAGALGALIYRRLNPPQAPPPPPPRPAYDVAIEKLVAIKSADLIEEGLFEEHTVRVSEAVREYLGRRYNLSLTDKQGLELTTEELLASMKEIQWPATLGDHFVEIFLADCDMVKFARYTPTADESEELLTQAFKLVELTRPTLLGVEATAETVHGNVQEPESEEGREDDEVDDHHNPDEGERERDDVDEDNDDSEDKNGDDEEARP